MQFLINVYFRTPFQVRVILVLFVCIFIGWKVLRRIVFHIIVFIPIIIGKVFRYLFLIMELPISFAHKKCGSTFFKIDNGFSAIGKLIDNGIQSWYQSWKNPKPFSWIKTLIFYLICTVYTLIPTMISTDNDLLKMGENCYLAMEARLENWCEQKYDTAVDKPIVSEQVFEEDESEVINNIGVLVAYGLNTSLLVRDMPDMQNGTVLTRIYNGNKVFWNGEIAFSEVEDKIEPWVKITTDDGVEGWSRLLYLYPEEYLTTVYVVKKGD